MLHVLSEFVLSLLIADTNKIRKITTQNSYRSYPSLSPPPRKVSLTIHWYAICYTTQEIETSNRL